MAAAVVAVAAEAGSEVEAEPDLTTDVSLVTAMVTLLGIAGGKFHYSKINQLFITQLTVHHLIIQRLSG